MSEGKAIAKDVLDRPVKGVNLSEGSLRAQLGFGSTLFVFLRHLG